MLRKTENFVTAISSFACLLLIILILNTPTALAQDETEGPFAILGDTQQTSWMEAVFLQRERNAASQKILIEALSQQKLTFLVLLGDMVFDGASSADWAHFDRLFSPFFQKDMPIWPVMGNHEYWGENEAALQNVLTRFPQLRERLWYWRKHKHLGLVFLDSNKDEYSPEKWLEQKKWFGKTLREMEADTTISAILVFTHHPPFTNSCVSGDELHVQESFLPDFFACRKAVIFFSGHAHGYERFTIGGKKFIVSGGGGAPRVKHLRGRKARHCDEFSGASPRPFHFLLVYPETHRIRIEVFGMEKGETAVRLIDGLSVITKK